MNAIRICRANIVRMLRDRQGLFFTFALPVVIIVVFGLAFGGSGTRYLGISDADRGPLARELVTSIEANRATLEIKTFGSAAELRDAVQRNTVEMGLVIPAGYEASITSGGSATVEVVTRPDAIGGAVRSIVDDAVGRQAALLKAAAYAANQRGIPFEAALAQARMLQPGLGTIRVESETTGARLIEDGMNGYVMGAQSQLVLFMFLTSMTAAAQLILSRRLGVSRRMFATPTSPRTILLGETLGRFGVAMIQGLFIFLATALIFGVKWGDPLAALAVIVAFGLVSTGVAMLVGAVANNPEQASSIGVGVAMLLGAFGGAMVPPEVFPEIMRTLSHLTPHAWAIDALRAVALRDADLLGILPQVGVLLGIAGLTLAFATIRFRRAVVG